MANVPRWCLTKRCRERRAQAFFDDWLLEAHRNALAMFLRSRP